MSKRFTDTEKWNDPWFIGLSPTNKLLWNYICDRCDPSGVIDLCPELATVQIGAQIAEDSMHAFGKRVLKLESGKWQIVKFLSFQYKTIDANCRAHKHVILAILSNGLKYPIENFPDRVSDRVLDTQQETEEEEDKEEETDKDMETSKDRDMDW